MKKKITGFGRHGRLSLPLRGMKNKNGNNKAPIPFMGTGASFFSNEKALYLFHLIQL